MPITTVLIANPRLAIPAHDFMSVTESRDLPRKHDCLPDDEANAIYGSDPGYFCQTGCDENGFQYIVEPGDKIPLQFRAPDSLNVNPLLPVYGWREEGATFLVGMDIMNMDGTVAFDGNIAKIADYWSVGADDRGPIQNAMLNVDKILAFIDGDCFYIRVKVVVGVLPANSANGEERPEGVPPVGYRYIDFMTNEVLEWSGSEWVPIGPDEAGEVWYSAETMIWYRWSGVFWQGLATRPRPEDPTSEFDYYTSMQFRLRKCNERIVHFVAADKGIDCAGWSHAETPRAWVMEPVDGLTFVDFYTLEQVSDHLDQELGVLIIGPVFEAPVRRVDSVTGWEVTAPSPSIGDRFLLMFDGGGFTAGDVIERTAWVPFVGFWALVGTFESLYPGLTFDNSLVPTWSFQHDFKVLGSSEIDQLPVARELTQNGRLVRRTSERKARVRCTGMPEQVAIRVQAVLASKNFTVDGEWYTEADGLRKNNEEGLLWWPDFAVGREDCSIAASCD